jgi:hypothetical protein
MSKTDALHEQESVSAVAVSSTPPAVATSSNAPRVGRRWLWIGGAIVVVGLGLALNWSWLVAAGIAPLILGLAPCAAMCALGLCMFGRQGR